MKHSIKTIIFAGVILIVYKVWFTQAVLASGDWHYLFSGSLYNFPFGFWSWDPSYMNGLGGNDIYLLGLNSYFLNGSHFFLNITSFSWWIVERVMWFFPYLFAASFSTYYLYKKVFPNSRFWIYSVALFLFSTYTLLVIGGGQMGVAMAIALFPLVLGVSMHSLNILFQKKIPIQQHGILFLVTILVLGLQVFFDIRIVYITLVSLLLYTLFNIQEIFTKRIFIFFFICIGALLPNAFWILPLFVTHTNPYGTLEVAYSSENAVRFFSFANFENAFGLLHPNWPENIFGKVGFMKPEFLLLPLFAFSSLLFVGKDHKEKKGILFFGLIGLLGVFLAKGANDPFGAVYLWMFDHVPGFVMFRDPTKWYVLIVLSYAMLIPYTIEKIYFFLKKECTK